MQGKAVRASSAIILIAAVAIVGFRLLSPPQGPGLAPIIERNSGSQIPEPRPTSQVVSAAVDETGVTVATTTSIDSDKADAMAADVSRRDSPSAWWPGSYRRQSFALAAYLLGPHDVAVSSLVRHVRLNPRDRPIDSARITDLERRVALLNDAKRGPLEDCSMARSQELIDLIDAGALRGRKPRGVSDQMIRQVARAMAKRDGTPDAVDAKFDELRAEIDKDPLYMVSVPDGAMLHDGKLYDVANVASAKLPVSSTMRREILKNLAWQAASIVDWFLFEGLMSKKNSS